MRNKNHELQATRYLPIIGLEVHVELKTKSKMFCSCSSDYFGHEPNTHVCPVCLGLPGALPVPNKQAMEWCAMLGMALNCQVPAFSKFDRKNYFYPDLPKGYQISQYDLPFCINGWVDIKEARGTLGVTRGKENHEPQAKRHKRIYIRRVHQEEDTAKLVHVAGSTGRVENNLRATSYEPPASLIDFNRSCVPLVEIVTEPDIRSAQEAKLFLQKLQQIIRYLGISDCDMEKGSMRLEPNISLKRIKKQELRIKNDELPKYKVEVKNINSFRFLERAIDYEIKRQTELLESGEMPKQETRGFDEIKMRTLPQRGKEEAHDYRYFPEPDIPSIRWEDKKVEEIRVKIPELPDAKLSRFIGDYRLSEYDANLLTATLPLANYFEEAVKVNEKLKIKNEKFTETKTIANWIINKRVDIEQVLPAELVQQILQTTQVTTIPEAQLKEIIKKVLFDNPQAASDYKKGKTQALMFLVGQVMKAAGGKANPGVVKKLLEEKL